MQARMRQTHRERLQRRRFLLAPARRLLSGAPSCCQVDQGCLTNYTDMSPYCDCSVTADPAYGGEAGGRRQPGERACMYQPRNTTLQGARALRRRHKTLQRLLCRVLQRQRWWQAERGVPALPHGRGRALCRGDWAHAGGSGEKQAGMHQQRHVHTGPELSGNLLCPCSRRLALRLTTLTCATPSPDPIQPFPCWPTSCRPRTQTRPWQSWLPI